jgi:sulfatase modifying factor 1
MALLAGCGSGTDGALDAGVDDAADDAPELDDATMPDDASPRDDGAAPDDVAETSSDDAGTDDADVAADTPDGAGEPCPEGMALVDGAFCIDLYEGALEEQNPDGSWTAAAPYFTIEERVVRAVPAAGLYPQGYISGSEAQAACERSGKRLCTSPEWLAACQGPAVLTWPYGNVHIDGACNDHYAGGHPVVDFFGTSDGVWDMVHMNDPGINQQPGTIARGGEFSGCISAWGAFDMHGNLHEWVADAEGTFHGGFYADASINGPGCLYRTTAHEMTYHDYSTGFRCCADL